MPAGTIDALLEEFGDAPLTEVDYRRERARLERTFLNTYNIQAGDIDELISSGGLHDSEMVHEWISLRAFTPFVEAEPRRSREANSQPQTSRESGSFFFRPMVSC